jgi:hypothetical protein
MAGAKSAKKNDSIEIRLPDEMKSAFREKCRREGRTASDALRSLIEEQLERRRGAGGRRSLWRIAAAVAVGAVLGGGLAAPSIAASGDGVAAAMYSPTSSSGAGGGRRARVRSSSRQRLRRARSR